MKKSFLLLAILPLIGFSMGDFQVEVDSDGDDTDQYYDYEDDGYYYSDYWYGPGFY